MADQEITKQIGEKFVIGNDFATKLPTNTALVSSIVLATRMGKSDMTTLLSSASAGAMTLQLSVNPGNGAALLLNEGRTNEEPLLVTSVSGSSSPYTATLASPLQVGHAVGETVKYNQGASDLLLASTTATVSGTILGANIIGGLIYEYRVTFLATITNNQILRDDVTLIIKD